MNDRAIRRFAWYSIGFAVFHFTVETAYHVRYGQFLPGLIVDYIAVALLVAGGWLALFKGWHAGLLCGAWGFEFCLTYRSFFWRVEDIIEGDAVELTRQTVYPLGVFLIVALASFVVSVRHCAPNRRDVRVD